MARWENGRWTAKALFFEKSLYIHDRVIKWKYFPRYWPFVWGIHRSSVNFLHKGQWRGALMFSLICVWINGWVNNRDAGDLRRYRAHYDVTVMDIHYNGPLLSQITDSGAVTNCVDWWHDWLIEIQIAVAAKCSKYDLIRLCFIYTQRIVTRLGRWVQKNFRDMVFYMLLMPLNMFHWHCQNLIANTRLKWVTTKIPSGIGKSVASNQLFIQSSTC